MSDWVLFVDLENVQKLDLSAVPSDVRVMVFCGVTQKSLPAELVAQAQPLGSRLQWVRIAGQGRNALDFHIAFYLGRELAVRPQTECAVLSKDTGFDPLVRHLAGLGHGCRRVSLPRDAFPSAGKSARTSKMDSYGRVLELLGKEKHRPRKRTGLVGKLKSYLPQVSAKEREALLVRLVSEGKVTEWDGQLSYPL
jgi:hypothetical protein